MSKTEDLLGPFDEKVFKCLGCKNFHSIEERCAPGFSLLCPRRKIAKSLLKNKKNKAFNATYLSARWQAIRQEWINLTLCVDDRQFCKSCWNTLYSLSHPDNLRLFRSWITHE
jgi:hypothetical protein